MEREIVQLTRDQIADLWDGIYFCNDTTEVDIEGVKYVFADKINRSEYCDGDCFRWIVKRVSDSKFFKFEVWETSDDYEFSDGNNTLEEVFPQVIIQTVYN